MNILVIANIPPYVTGGAETQARFLAERFAARGHTVVVAGHEVENGSIEYQGKQINVVRIPVLGWNRAFSALSYFFSLSVYLLRKRKKFDIVYCRFVKEAALTVSVLKYITSLQIQLVPCTACAGSMGDAKYLKMLPFSKRLVSILGSQCNVINNISPATREEFLSLGIAEEKLTLIPNGISLAKSQLKPAFDGARSFVYLGRLAEQKGLMYLLLAFRQLKEAGYKCDLQLIGDGPERARLEREVEKLNLGENITFTGHIDNKEIPAALSRHDIMVMPSLNEGFCTAVVEAMYAGLPVIVTRSGGPEYFVDETVGRTCDTASVEQLAENMGELVSMSDEQLMDMGREGHERVLQRFDIEKVADQYLELFQYLLSRKFSG